MRGDRRGVSHGVYVCDEGRKNQDTELRMRRFSRHLHSVTVTPIAGSFWGSWPVKRPSASIPIGQHQPVPSTGVTAIVPRTVSVSGQDH